MKKSSDFFIFNNPHRKKVRQNLRNNQTEAEKIFWAMVKDGGLLGCRFRRQYGIGIFIVDFYCPKLKLAVEIDGGQHNQRIQEDYDKSRTDYFKDFKIKVIRYWNNDILNNLDGVHDDLVSNIKLRNKELIK